MARQPESLRFPVGSLGRPVPGLAARGLDEVVDRLNDDSLSAADGGDLDQHEAFLRQIAWCPRQRRHELRMAMTLSAQVAPVRLPGGVDGEALLMRIPLLVVTDRTISSLPVQALRPLNASLHQHGLLDPAVQILFLPWLEPEGSAIDNLVSRRRLLLELALHLVQDRANPLPDVHVEPRPPAPIDTRGTHTRYLTLAMLGADIELQSVIDSWKRAGETVRRWSAQVGELIKSAGGHELVAVSLPTAYAQAEMKGGLHRGAFEIKRFLIAARRESKASPGECEVQLITRLAGERGMGLRYLHDGRQVGETWVALPVGSVACDALEAEEVLRKTARSLCQAIGVKRVTELRQQP